jgi:hypothetical protein
VRLDYFVPDVDPVYLVTFGELKHSPEDARLTYEEHLLSGVRLPQFHDIQEPIEPILDIAFRVGPILTCKDLFPFLDCAGGEHS